jgi:hypothetical protein
MFERYTEKARRVVFYARWEASQFGSHEITTEHLLLALFHEARGLLGRLVPRASEEAARHLIENLTPPGKPVPTSVDMPLSQAAKRVLAFAAEEAERLNHKHIGTEHLLLGLAREKECLAANILSEAGFDPVHVREVFVRVAPPRHIVPVRADFTREAEGWAVLFQWTKRHCEPRDALKNRVNQRLSLYTGETYDAMQFELVQGGWTNYPCFICWRDLYIRDNPDRSVGYTNGQEWICPSCYDTFAAPVGNGADEDE